jgi:hypothetical protein
MTSALRLRSAPSSPRAWRRTRRRTIDRVVEAAEDRDAAEVVQSLSSTYAERADVELELRRYFFGYEHIDVTVRESSHHTRGRMGNVPRRLTRRPEAGRRARSIPPPLGHTASPSTS